MTETEALPSIFAIFIVVPTLVSAFVIIWFFGRAQMKADYYPEHWKDVP
jgi:hypothetical protein